MQRYVTGRLLLLLPTLLGVSLVVFVVMRLLPGDPVEAITGGGQGVTVEQKARLREELGLNHPRIVQYVAWVGGLLRFDLGRSVLNGDPIGKDIKHRLPVTAELAIGAVAVSTLLALPFGVLGAVFQDRLPDYIIRVISIAGIAVPIFWLQSLVRNYFLPKYFGWIPPAGYANPWDNLANNLQQMWLPVLLLGYYQSAVVTRLTRSTMLDVLREDYIRTARAKGLGSGTVIVRHAVRNALLPVLTLAAIQLGALLGGAAITESVFSLPGIGTYVVDAINKRDYPVVQAVVMLAATVFVLLNLIVDLLYGVIDPRVRLG